MLKVIKAGFLSSIQDAGRFGCRHFGVPVSGAMDRYSSQYANMLLGNDNNAAVLELTMAGPVLQFHKPTAIVISGADMQPAVNGIPIHQNTIIQIESKDILKFGRLKNGFRTYLAIKDGFETATVLGSKSYFAPITEKNRIATGDELNYKPCSMVVSFKSANLRYDASVLKRSELEVLRGPEFLELDDTTQHTILNTDFVVSPRHNRMAYQLEPIIRNSLKSILTAPVLPGTVQLTPSGQLMVLTQDCQTTGGYPRILQLTAMALNILSQKRTGNHINFSLKA